MILNRNITLQRRNNLIVNKIFSFTTVVVPETSNGASDGSITVTPKAGVSPYTYSLDGVTYQGSNVFSGLAAATYTVYVKDNVGTVIHAPVVVGLKTQYYWGTSYGHVWGTSAARKWGSN